MYLPLGIMIAIVAFYALMYGAAIVRLTRLRSPLGQTCVACNSTEAPDWLRDLLQEKADKLQQWGFRPAFWFRIDKQFVRELPASYICVLYSAEYQTYVEIGMHPVPQMGDQVSVSFVTIANHGDVIYTCNGIKHYFAAAVEGWDVDDGYCPTLEDQWQFHRSRLEKASTSFSTLEPEQFVSLLNDFTMKHQQSRIEQGLAIQDEAGKSLRYSVKGAFSFLRRGQKARASLQQMVAQQPKTERSSHRVEVDLALHTLNEAYRDVPRGKGNSKLILLLVSVVAFLASFGFHLNVKALVILVGVLLVHELGHVVAMRWVGFRDLQVLFIPFLGAVALGKPSACRPWQRAVISLAGPVPGIVAGVALLMTGIGSDHSWMPMLVAMLLILNYFNLLPVQPLDGGQLVNLLLFQRWPRFQILFFWVSGLALFAVSWWFKAPLFAVLAIFILMASRHQYRETTLIRHVHLHYGAEIAGDDESRLRSLYSAMADLNLPWNYATRFQVALKQRDQLRMALPSSRESIGGLGVYLVLLIGVPALLLHLQYPPLRHLLRLPAVAQESENWDAELAKAKSDEERVEILIEAGDDTYWANESKKSSTYYQRARDLLIRDGKTQSPQMARLLLSQGRSSLDMKGHSTPAQLDQAEQYADKSIALYQQLPAQRLPSDDDSASYLSQAYSFKASLMNTRGDPQAALSLYEKALQVLKPDSEFNHYTISGILRNQARIHAKLGETEKAEQLFVASIDQFKTMSGHKDMFVLDALDSLVTFQLDHKRYTQAVRDLDRYLPAESKRNQELYLHLLDDRYWAEIQLAHYAEAITGYEDLVTKVPVKSRYSSIYWRADLFTRLLLARHENAGGGSQPYPLLSKQGFPLIMQALADHGKTLKDYKKHLDCECNRKAGGYRLEQSLQMRSLINQYSGGA